MWIIEIAYLIRAFGTCSKVWLAVFFLALINKGIEGSNRLLKYSWTLLTPTPEPAPSLKLVQIEGVSSRREP